MAEREQLSLSEALMSPAVGRNEALERLVREVKWYRFEKLLGRLKPEGAGRPPFDPLLMFKALLLQQWYRLSDAELEEALNDRMSFRRFLGLSLEDASPDHTTLCRFRNRLVEAGLAEKLFAEFERQLERHGLLLKRGTMIDATLVETPFRPGRNDEAAEDAAQPVDEDAALTAREGKRGTHYGYKAHAGVDVDTRLIRRLVLTPANVNETVVADTLICGDERAVYGDKAYAKKARRAWLHALGIKDRIMHKTWGGGPPLTASQKRDNAAIAPTRAQVEGVFATLKRWMGFDCVRYNARPQIGRMTAEIRLATAAQPQNRRPARQCHFASLYQLLPCAVPS
jgi:IS5 family transposase